MTIWSWKSPVDCTTLESNVETLIRDNVYLANVRLESSQAELGIFHKSLFFNTTLP
jgi:hypothetical protein